MNTKFIHLLFVPTMACNMQCKYCYLEENTKDLGGPKKPIDTLKYAVQKLKENNVIPFNISLHGGEVTTLNKQDFYDIIEFIDHYYQENKTVLEENNFKVGSPHIKTNLYDLEKHIDTIKKFNVSISGSLDLPLSLHKQFRVTKGKQETLSKILENIHLLDALPNKRKVSATIFKEHYDKIEEIIEDIRYLEKNTTLDMNDFNFMIGFDYASNGLLTPLTEEEQVDFFHRMHEAFDGTSLDKGVNGAWFNEFGPEYCTNCDNCGEKFFLLEKNGDIYSCVRGQKHPDFYYGNIYQDSVSKILETAMTKIFTNHNKEPFLDECAKCPYLYICKTGCPFVKNLYHSSKSYTCKLQKELYKKRNYELDTNMEETTYQYALKMHPNLLSSFLPEETGTSDMPSLKEIIDKDNKLHFIYDPNAFFLKVDDRKIPLESQILKKSYECIYLTPRNKVTIYVQKKVLEESDYPANNALYIILLSGDLITYGDEGRTKQKHIMSHQIYQSVLENSPSDEEEFYAYDITELLKAYAKYLSKEKANNIFFTTNDLRDYHYLKQKNNAYYHIQAINLPFQNIEFHYVEEDSYDF